MPKVPRDKAAKATPAPKKRTRKTTTSADGDAIHAGNGNGAVLASVTVSTEGPIEVHGTYSLEEKIRVRAYELYLQRGGHGGSPEQDWLRAVEEICGQQRTA